MTDDRKQDMVISGKSSEERAAAAKLASGEGAPAHVTPQISDWGPPRALISPSNISQQPALLTQRGRRPPNDSKNKQSSSNRDIKK